MPELPEVETITRRLRPLITGLTIDRIEQHHPKSFQGDPQKVAGQTVTSVERRGKVIRIGLPNQMNLLVHLKMTGQLIYLDNDVRVGGGHPTADWISNLPSKHTRVSLHFSDKEATLFFNDQRLFGWVKVASDEEADEHFAKLGPDVIDSSLTAEYLYNICQRRSMPIKLLILDSSVMAGLGNIYACDALNLARIHPTRPAKSLSFDEASRLLDASREILQKGIDLGGTTFDGGYVDVAGFAGEYQSVVRTYGREGKPCLNCGQPIAKMKLGGRGTYFCPNCQV